MADPLIGDQSFDPAEAQLLADGAPEATRRLLLLYRAYRNQGEQLQSLQGRAEMPDATETYEEVRDWVQDRSNYFDALDRAAEDLAASIGLSGPTAWEALTARLRELHGIEVLSEPELLKDGTVWRLQRREGLLLLAGRGDAGEPYVLDVARAGLARATCGNRAGAAAFAADERKTRAPWPAWPWPTISRAPC